MIDTEDMATNPHISLPCVVLLLVFLWCSFLYVFLIPVHAGEPTLAPAYQKVVDSTWDILKNIVVVDGDTIKAEIYLGRGVTLKSERIRLEGFDAWESSRYRRTVHITNAEIVKGTAAAVALSVLINKSEVRCLTDGGKDSYGRPVGYLRLIQRDGSVIKVEEYMKEYGHDRNNDVR